MAALAHDFGGGRRIEVARLPQGAEGSRRLEFAAQGFGAEDLLLHWGVHNRGGAGWAPPASDVCAQTSPPSREVPGAAQTTFPAAVAPEGGGPVARRVRFCFPAGGAVEAVEFVLHQPRSNAWLKPEGQNNFLVSLPAGAAAQDRREGGAPMVPGPGSRPAAGAAAASALSWRVGDFELTAQVVVEGRCCSVQFQASTAAELVLHYGTAGAGGGWKFARDAGFSRAPGAGGQALRVALPEEESGGRLLFVLRASGDQWLKDGGKDFEIAIPRFADLREAAAEAFRPPPRHDADETEKQRLAAERLQRERQAEEEAARAKAQAVLDAKVAAWQKWIVVFRNKRDDRRQAADVSYNVFNMSENAGDVDVSAHTVEGGRAVEVNILACLDPRIAPAQGTVLHWGARTAGRRKDWECPPEEIMPSGTKIMDRMACQTPFGYVDGIHGIKVQVPMRSSEDCSDEQPQIPGVCFVITIPASNCWLKASDGQDCVATFRQNKNAWQGACRDIADKIIDAEVEWSHMTLMHRYHFCKDLVGGWEGSLATGEDAPNGKFERLPSWGALFRPEDSSRRSSSFDRSTSFTRQLSIIPEDSQADSAKENAEFWSWMFVWQRFSFIKLLDWQRNYNTKPRELADATNALAQKLCCVWKAHPSVRLWVRWTLATLGRGGNRGQEIRDEILHIMHRNKIPECAGHFYEQWHQKLHNNTTPDDVAICRALLAFLRSGGNLDDYWRVLRDHGIGQERLASYERKITFTPYLHGDTGSLIYEFENYLKILQSVHDALDLQNAIENARWCLPHDLQHRLDNVCRDGGDGRARSFADLRGADTGALDDRHGRFMRAAEARQGLIGMLNDKRTEPNVIRELLLLDYALETQQSVLIQSTGAETRLVQLCDQMQALLVSVLGHIPMHRELRVVVLDWMRLAPECAGFRFSHDAVESALLLKAMCDRLSRVIGDSVDNFQNFMGPKALYLGDAIGAPKEVLDVFVDEVLRASALFSVSLVLKRLEPQLRAIAHLPPWQMIAAVDRPLCGELVSVPRMLHMQDKIFETPTILLSGAVSGEEEVPVGVQAVLVRDAASAPDILSHCAVRARNSGVLLATCFDPEITKQLESTLVGEWVQVSCGHDGTVKVEKAARPDGDAERMRKLSRNPSRYLAQEELQASDGKPVKMNLKDDLGCAWCVTPGQMDSKKVGSKSLNLAKLAPKLPKGVCTPQAVAMPYGAMQKVLTHGENKKTWLPTLEKTLEKLQPTTGNDEAREIFESVQAIINALEMPKELEAALTQSMASVGKGGEERLCSLYDSADAWSATKQVWASLFALRPWVSLARAKRSFHDLNMAVLVQELLPAKYAFVLHTKNPFTNDPDEVYGEIVPGRGETLVGNFAGRAVSFRAKKGEEPKVTAYLSKSVQLRTQECLIFRSDSNGEDLEGFAGAGLFESICARPDVPLLVKYHQLQLINDLEYRRDLLRRIAKVGRDVEQAFGGVPQDIEGCVDPQDRIFIVQSRPQV